MSSNTSGDAPWLLIIQMPVSSSGSSFTVMIPNASNSLITFELWISSPNTHIFLELFSLFNFLVVSTARLTP